MTLEEALLRLRESTGLVEIFRTEAGKRELALIRQITQLAYADGLAQAVDEWLKAEVKQVGADKAAETLILALKAYKGSRDAFL